MLNRRTLIKSALALGAAAATPVLGQNNAEQKPRKQNKLRKWKLAFMATLDYGSMKPADVIKSLKKLGYDGIEWTTGHLDMTSEASLLTSMRELAKQTRDGGMEISRIASFEDFVCLDEKKRKLRIDTTVAVIKAAGECGISNVGTTIGPFPWNASSAKIGKDIPESKAWGLVFEAYEAFTKAANSAGVIITSEAVFGMLAHDFYTHKFMMDKLDSSVQKVNLDPSHGILYGNLDVGWVVRQWGDRIGHVHLKDAVGIPEKGKFLFPLLGEGLVDWKAFFKGLDDIGYTGFCSVEFESFGYYKKILKGNPEAAAKISIENIKAMTRF